MNSKQR